MPNAEELAFLAQVREHPEDDGPRFIFADWLDERRDPRGEFIRVQCALHHLPDDDPRRDELNRREQELLERHKAEWTAHLNGVASAWTYRRGFIESISVDTLDFLRRGDEILRRSAIRRVRFLDASRSFARLVESPLLGKIPQIDLFGNALGNGALHLLARAGQLTRLEVLQLGMNDITDQGLRALAGIPHLTSLRELYLDDNGQIGMPGIRALADSPYLTQLRRLDLSGNNLQDSAVRVLIDAASLRQLDSLALHGNQIGDGGVEALAGSELLKRMLARSSALNLANNNIGPVGARALAESPATERLETLDLTTNVISDAGLTYLAQSPYLLNLKRLLVKENRISDAGVLALARSRLPASLIYIDWTGNFVTSDSTCAVDDAAKSHDWRKQIEQKFDPGLQLRALRQA